MSIFHAIGFLITATMGPFIGFIYYGFMAALCVMTAAMLWQWNLNPHK